MEQNSVVSLPVSPRGNVPTTMHLVTKANESAHVRHLTDDGHREEFSAQETKDLLDAVDRPEADVAICAPPGAIRHPGYVG